MNCLLCTLHVLKPFVSHEEKEVTNGQVNKQFTLSELNLNF
jgi:hypothetical protein